MTSRQNTVITASGADPEGKSITWSFEEVVSGSKVIVAASHDDDNGASSGSVYVYDANDLSAQPIKLRSPDASHNHKFGNSVAAINDKIVIGESGGDKNPNDNAGAVYVYDANDLSVQPTKLTAFDGAAFDQFGYSVDVTADQIVVGAMWDDDSGSSSGSVYVYDANDLSAQPTKLTAFDGDADDWFGYSVSATDDKIIVGSLMDDDNGNNSGSVYVYDANDLSAQPTKLTAFDGDVNDRFGYPVVGTANNIIVGATGDNDNGSYTGSVYVYDANDLSAQPTKLTAFDADGGDQFGISISATTDKIVIGSFRDDDNGENSGSVYVFDANDLPTTPTKLTAFDGAADDIFGKSVSATADKIIVAASYDDTKGSVYVYDANNLSATPTKLTAFDGAANDRFGHSVDAISAPSQLNGTTVSQSNNVFTITPGIGDANFTLRFIASDNFGTTSHKDVSFTHDYINAAPEIQGIESSYTLTQEQDTVITATAIDVEGDDVTWSYSVVGGVPEKNYVGIVAAGETNKIHLYDSTDLNISPIIVTAPDGVYFNRGLSSYKNDILSSSGSLFAFDGHNTFSSEELVSYDAETTDYLGYSMVVHGDNIFLSAPGEESYTGAVYVYNAEDLSAQPLKLTAPDGAESDWFGRVIEIVGDRLYVSAPYDDDVASNSGSVYVFDINNLNANPIKLNSTGSDVSNYNLGTSITGLSQGKIAIGAQWADNPSGSSGSTHSTGAVYVFDENNLTGTPIALIPSDITTNDLFGRSVSASADKLFIGCPRDDEGANQNLDFDTAYNSGSVYVYDANNLSAAPTKITAPNTIYNGWFGEKVLVVGDKLYVGSRYENVDRIQARSDRYQNSDFYDDPTGYGAVYVYDVNNLSAPPIKLTSDSDEKTSFGWNIVSLYIPESDILNGVTVSQSDNVFTITPARQDANFNLKFTATDSVGNVATKTTNIILNYVNQSPVVTGIQSVYTMTQGQDTVITASATDIEGDDITWSYEEVPTETSLVALASGSQIRIYDNTLLESSPNNQSVGRIGEFSHGSYSSPYPTEVVVSNNRIFVGDSGYNNNKGSI